VRQARWLLNFLLWSALWSAYVSCGHYVFAVLRERTGLSDPQLVAVVDAAARWLAEERGADYAWALLEAVSRDEETTRLAFRVDRPAAR